MTRDQSPKEQILGPVEIWKDTGVPAGNARAPSCLAENLFFLGPHTTSQSGQRAANLLQNGDVFSATDLEDLWAF